MQNSVVKFTIIAVIFATIGLVVPQEADAATLTFRAMFPSRVQASLASGVSYSFAWTPATSLSGGADNNQVVLRFPDATDGEWCRTAGALSVAAFTNDFTGTAPTDPGAAGASATCAQGSGASDYDYIVVTDLDDMTSGTKYGVTISDSTGELGTSSAGDDQLYTICTDDQDSAAMDDQCSTEVDSGTGAFSIIADDTVTVTASIQETFAFSLSTTTCALGALSLTEVDGCVVTLTTTTNAADGYVTTVRDEATGLDNDDSGTELDDVADGSITAGGDGSGNAEYGISTEDSDADISQFSGGSITGANCTTGLAGPLSSFSAMTTTNQSVVETATPASSEAIDVCIAVSIGTNEDSGTYTDEVTFVSTGYF